MTLGTENLNSFFNPHAIAVIGASNQEDSLGAKIFRNLNESHKGSVFPINPFRPTVQGVAAYPSISKVPSKIDLAIIATPAHTIPQIIEECGKAKVQSIIIVSAGLSESDENGQELTRQILEHKKNYGLRIIGPNSLGIIRPKTNLQATFAEKKAIPGKIAFISQSAALCGSVLDWSFETQVGLSGVVSTGSALDIDLSDLIDYFGADSQTRSIMLYVESIKNIRSFMSAARGFARTKPIVLVKAGRFTENRNLKLPHSNQLGNEDALYDAAFRRVGVVRVETINELFDCAKALSMQPNPNDDKLTIITNASGPARLAVDQLISRGGKLTQISNGSAENLKNILPHYCDISNPIDILEEATPDRFRKVIQVCLNDPSINNLLIIYTPLGATNSCNMANMVIELAKQTRKKLFISLMGEDNICQEARRTLNRNGIPAFKTPEDAVNTFMYVYAYGQNLKLLYQTPEELPANVDTPIHLKATIRQAYCEGRKILNLAESLSFLEAYKIPILNTRLASTLEEASAIVSEFGYPVILKPLFCPTRYTSECEDPTFEVCSSSEMTIKFNSLISKTKDFKDPTDFQGIAIQPKIYKGYRLFIGSRKSLKFGAAILFGKAEAASDFVKDISIGFPPLNQILAMQILENTKDLQLAKSVQGINALQMGMVEQILVKFSQLVTDFPEIREVDINPIVVEGNNAFAVDARITIDRDRVIRQVADHHEHMIIAPYPIKYITKRTLRNGQTVKLRPIKPEDEICFNELFKSLSEESIRFRFFETIKEMAHDTLTRYCNLDYDREIAIVAESQSEQRIIGAVRLVLDAGGKNGEFAIMVGDSWHGLGLGSKLMDYIVDIAKDLRLETIYSYVTRANTKMINMCSKKGFEIQPIDEYTINMNKKISI
jgi:acetyltransferase